MDHDFLLLEPIADPFGWHSALLHGLRQVGTVMAGPCHQYTFAFTDPDAERQFAAAASKHGASQWACRECDDCVSAESPCRILDDPQAALVYSMLEVHRWNASETPVTASGQNSNRWYYTSDPDQITHRWDWITQAWEPVATG